MKDTKGDSIPGLRSLNQDSDDDVQDQIFPNEESPDNRPSLQEEENFTGAVNVRKDEAEEGVERKGTLPDHAVPGIGEGLFKFDENTQGLSNQEAVSLILQELKKLLKDKEKHFKDHRQKVRKKIEVTFKRIASPFTLLTFLYLACLAFNIVRLMRNKDALFADEAKRSYFWAGEGGADFMRHTLIQHCITLVVVVALVYIDFHLQISRLNNRVHNVDKEVWKVIDKYEDKSHQVNSKATTWSSKKSYKRSGKEFPSYKNCFTDTLRKGIWRNVPSNTLAQGDIIRLMPGEIAPAFIQRVNVISYSPLGHYPPFKVDGVDEENSGKEN